MASFGKFMSYLLPAASIAAPLVSGYMQFSAARKASEDQEDIAQRNAQRTLDEATEASRQMTLNKEQTQARMRAMGGASGFAASGTPAAFQEEAADVADREIDWTKKAAASRAEIERDEGSITAANTSALGTQSLLGGIASGLGQGYKIGNERGWF